MLRLPSPVVTRKRIYFLCLGCTGPDMCNWDCRACKGSNTKAINLEVCLELHNHRSFGPELFGQERCRDFHLPFSPLAVKKQLETKHPPSASKIAIAKAKREVKRGIQKSILSFVVDKTEVDYASSSDDEKKPAARK